MTTRGSPVANVIVSTRSGRPVVKTSMLMGKDAAKTMASLSNGFAVASTPTNTGVLRISFMNVVARRIPVAPKAVEIALGGSTGLLSRIIMATLNVTGGRGSLACSARMMGNSRLTHIGSPGVVGTLTNGATNIRVGGDSSNLKNSSGIVVHNGHSMDKDGRPLCIVSNMPFNSSAGRGASAAVNKSGSDNGCSHNSNVSGLGPSSVRDVGVLGNPTTTTLCNDSTTGNIIVVAAGGNGRKHTDVDFGADAAFSVTTCNVPRFRGRCANISAD